MNVVSLLYPNWDRFPNLIALTKHPSSGPKRSATMVCPNSDSQRGSQGTTQWLVPRAIVDHIYGGAIPHSTHSQIHIFCSKECGGCSLSLDRFWICLGFSSSLLTCPNPSNLEFCFCPKIGNDVIFCVMNIINTNFVPCLFSFAWSCV